MFIYLVIQNNFPVKPTLPLCFPKIVCALFSPIPTKREGGGCLFALWMWRRKFFIVYDIKARFHEATFMLWQGCMIFKNVPIF